MCAGGAAAGGIAGAAGAPPPAQVAVAIVVGLALLAFVRPIAKRHLNPGVHVMGTAALVGKDAVVLSRVDAHDGRVRLNGGEWSAKSFDETQVMQVGTVVRVMKIDGATALVWDHSDLAV